MKWLLKEPAAGDMIRVKLGSIYHYGIFASEDEIIQFGLAPVARPNLAPADIEVCTSDIDEFLCGAFLEVAEFDKSERKKHRSAKDTLKYARSKLGSRGYHILYNNCEHFAYECLTGQKYCSQTDGVRSMFQEIPVVDVYVARIPSNTEFKPLLPKERYEEILSVGSEKVKAEKYYVWKLLEYGIERSLGYRMKKLEFQKGECGKWIANKCEFSLSHSDGVVAVAVSRKPVGIDIQLMYTPLSEKFADKILTQSEKALLEQTPEDSKDKFLIERWSAKESLFKKEGLAVFSPSKYDTTAQNVQIKELTLNGQTYILSVATDSPQAIRYYTDVDQSKL